MQFFYRFLLLVIIYFYHLYLASVGLTVNLNSFLAYRGYTEADVDVHGDTKN